MDVYQLLVLLHVVSATIWVGGGFTLMVAVEVLRRRRGPDSMMVVIDAVALLGPPFFVPVSLLTVVFGAAAAWMGFGFDQLWVALGLTGFTATFLTGVLALKPRAEKLSAMMQQERGLTPDILAMANELISIARFDYVMLGLVVAVMVLKPAVGDTLILATMGGVLVLGAAVTLGRVIRRPAHRSA
jgi:hypothetical protein